MRLVTKVLGVAFAAAAAFDLAACSHRNAPASTVSAPVPAEHSDPYAQLAPSDTAREVEANTETQLVALELAVNQLRPVVHQCWGAAAADDYLLEGSLVLQLSWPIERPGFPFSSVPQVAVGEDTTKDDVLTSCVVAVVRAYPWPATMRGAAFDVPFAFSAPRGQFAIDRRFVKAKQGAALSIATVMDAKNTGSRAATVADVEFVAGSDSQWGVADRDEAWVALSSGHMAINGQDQVIAVGDVMLVAPGDFRRLQARTAMRFAVVITPGGPEGTLHAGALPSRTFANAPRKAPVVYFPAAASEVKQTPNGTTRIMVDSSKIKTPFNVSLLDLTAGAAIATHSHPGAAELVYLQSGEGELTIGKVVQPVGAFHVILIPAGMSHSFVATTPVKAVQWYVPSKAVLR